jgi:hypothetical protein
MALGSVDSGLTVSRTSWWQEHVKEAAHLLVAWKQRKGNQIRRQPQGPTSSNQAYLLLFTPSRHKIIL